MKYKYPLLPLLFTAISFLAHAQPSPEEEEPVYTFQVIGWNRTHLDMFYLEEGGPRTLRLIQRTPSPPQHIAGTEKIQFYIPVETEEGSRPYLLTEATLYPPPARNLIVIWLNQNRKYQSVVLKDDPDTPAPGKLRLVNLSGHELRLKANDDPIISMHPGAIEIITPKNEGVGLKIAILKTPNSGWKLGLLNAITVRKNDRVTAFIADPSKIAPTLEETATNAQTDTSPLTLFVIKNRAK